MWKWLIPIVLCALVACEEATSLAPVVDGNWRSSDVNATRYRVGRGDTLFSIAFRYDQDYRRLAAINHLQSPYIVKVGQVIVLKSTYSSPPSYRNVPSVRRAQQPMQQAIASPGIRGSRWLWPARGPILASFAPGLGRKGIDIAGARGQTIRATANGTVAYAGDGLPGYGNLILIQHPQQLLSAYGYNARNLVHAGQTVRAGQPIAVMGTSPHRRYAMHFEVRKAGTPVNPNYYLH